MQKIQAISKSKTINYENEIVDAFWLKINEKPNFQEENNNLDQIISVFNEIQDSVICIQTEQIDHPEIIKTIFSASKKRNRIYILTNEKGNALKKLEGICLIRYGIKNIGSFILVNPNTSSAKGIIYTSPFIETSIANFENLSLELNKTQTKTLFRFFSDNFWNKAEYEIISDFDNPKETDEPPLDFLPNIKDFCDADFVKNEISKINNGANISVPNLQTNDLIKLTSLKNSAILTSLKNNDAELLKNIAKNNNSINSNSQNSNRIIIADNEKWLIPKTDISENDNFFALMLNAQQKQSLNGLFNKKFEKAEFEFNLSKTRKELENKTIQLLNNLDKEIKINPNTDIYAKNIELTELLPKEEFDKQEPEFEDDGISVKINYSWQIIPFFTPNNAKKARLYQDWEKYQNEYNAFISQIENAINESGSKNIGDKLKRWFLGKKQTISKLQQELEEIKEINLSILETSKRKEIIKKINELAKKASLNLFEIDTEIEKSEIETDIEQLKNQKEEKELELNIFIEEQNEKLKEKETNKKQKIDEFLKKHNKKENDLATFKSELQQKSGKKNRKKNPKEAEKAQEILNELKAIQGFDFSKKFEDDKAKKEKEIQNIENKINSKEKELKKAGKKQEQSEGSSLNTIVGKGQNNKSSIQNNEFSIPENIEYLPKVGELFEVGKQKFLEIVSWEDFELGQIETQRLNAKLSAKNNS